MPDVVQPVADGARLLEKLAAMSGVAVKREGRVIPLDHFRAVFVDRGGQQLGRPSGQRPVLERRELLSTSNVNLVHVDLLFFHMVEEIGRPLIPANEDVENARTQGRPDASPLRQQDVRGFGLPQFAERRTTPSCKTAGVCGDSRSPKTTMS